MTNHTVCFNINHQTLFMQCIPLVFPLVWSKLWTHQLMLCFASLFEFHVEKCHPDESFCNRRTAACLPTVVFLFLMTLADTCCSTRTSAAARRTGKVQCQSHSLSWSPGPSHQWEDGRTGHWIREREQLVPEVYWCPLVQGQSTKTFKTHCLI